MLSDTNIFINKDNLNKNKNENENDRNIFKYQSYNNSPKRNCIIYHNKKSLLDINIDDYNFKNTKSIEYNYDVKNNDID